MHLTLEIPDDVAARLCAEGGDHLSRRAMEAFLAEEYRQGRQGKPDLRRLLGFETGYRIDGFLKSHEVYEEYTMEDLEVAALRQLGI